jgi:hypothetical protein
MMSPFKSKSQRKYLYANNPEVAKKWELERNTPGELPEKVSKKHKRKK